MKLQLLLFALAMLILGIDQVCRKDVVNWFKQRWYMLGLRRLAARLNAQMVAATAISVLDRPGGFHFQIQFSLDPGNIAAGGREVETVAVPGAAIGDVVAISPRYATSLIVGYARVSAVGVITFSLENNTAGALDEGNNIWDCMIIRGSTGPLR
jgi:hypothetical protein